MKLANKVYIATLILLTFAFTAMAQSNARPESDPRNTAPTVGTGGSVGGPTGLFTVYDGQTLRRGEWTLSAAFSNYDRDPGNVDLSVVPVSFQFGLTNNVEVFFNVEAYRGVKVNSPRNLSSFYLPNSQVFVNGSYQQGPAIVMAPQGPGPSIYGGSAIFRPAGAPFVGYPFSGGNAGTFGLVPPFFSGPVFGFGAGTNAVLGPPRASSGGGADQFPGVGSVFGSILPGIVLQTTPLFNNAGVQTGTAPSIFTIAPSYLPDAPFINRPFGESAFNSFDVGFKWRFTNIRNAIGAGLVAAYTYNVDNADDASGFEQLQKGAGAGGKRGDVSLTFFADARVAKWANVSANVGYKYTSASKGNGFVLLDRPDELQAALALDFPVNKFFQPIVEYRTLYYVGGRTPNAFENSPQDLIAGARIFPVRWAGFGLAYRYHLNQQDRDSFDDDTTTTSSVVVPCTTAGTNCVPVTYTSSFRGVPPGFQASSDAHGFIIQAWIGGRKDRSREIPNQPAVVNSVSVSDSTITLGCQPGFTSPSGCNDSRTINISTSASDPENDVLTYNYTPSAGRIVGTGANVQWDVSGVPVGTYTITVGVDDGCGVCGQTKTETIRIEECTDCVKTCDCPTLSVSGPGGVTNPGDTMTFTANVSNPSGLTFNWSVDNGSIESGQGTRSITVRTTSEMGGSNVRATVDIDGLDENCRCTTTASESGGVATPPEAVLIDEFGRAVDDDVKARIDNFYIQLNNNPNAQGYIINYGTAAEIRKRKAQINKAINFRNYDPNRVTFVDGPNNGTGPETKLWLVPAGADNPNP